MARLVCNRNLQFQWTGADEDVWNDRIVPAMSQSIVAVLYAARAKLVRRGVRAIIGCDHHRIDILRPAMLSCAVFTVVFY